MKRKIIKIDEEKCNGCAACTKVCAEAALVMVDGKAKLVKDFLCDGMGVCLDVCPVGALQIVEEECECYDPLKAYEHVKEERGEYEAKKIHEYEKISDQVIKAEPMRCGCPGTMIRDMRTNNNEAVKVTVGSALRQWPVQLHLITSAASYLQDADLLISADCVPFAYANFHERFLKKKALVMFCPKLDQDQDVYLEKLTEIFKTCNIKSATIVRMEVPCCGGILQLVEKAIRDSDTNIIIKDYIISLDGNIM